MTSDGIARELHRSHVKDRIAHGVTVACLVALIVTFGAVMFYLGRLSVEFPIAPQRLTVEGRIA